MWSDQHPIWKYEVWIVYYSGSLIDWYLWLDSCALYFSPILPEIKFPDVRFKRDLINIQYESMKFEFLIIVGVWLTNIYGWTLGIFNSLQFCQKSGFIDVHDLINIRRSWQLLSGSLIDWYLLVGLTRANRIHWYCMR